LRASTAKGFNFKESKLEELYEKLAVATWNPVNISRN
jgi:hypothetical protein